MHAPDAQAHTVAMLIHATLACGAQVLVVDSMGGACLFAPFLLWIYDLPTVVRGRLQDREETVYFWTALIGWLSPFGVLGGFHFRQFGRPYDWQLFCSLTLIGGTVGATVRQYVSVSNERAVLLLTLISGVTCFGINIARWLAEAVDMHKDSLLRRQIGSEAFNRVRLLWLFSGLLCSGMARVPGGPICMAQWPVYDREPAALAWRHFSRAHRAESTLPVACCQLQPAVTFYHLCLPARLQCCAWLTFGFTLG